MKNIIYNCLILLVFSATGCSTSKKTTTEKDQASLDEIINYNVKAKSNVSNIHDKL